MSTGPVTNPPPGGPGREEEPPLDPRSPEGRAVAARLTRTLAEIELEINEREAAERASAA
jgi:hypothetical protein